MEAIWERLSGVFGPEAIGDWLSNAIPNIAVAAITFAIFYVLHRMVAIVLRRLLRSANVDPTAQAFVLTIAKVVVLSIGVVAALGQVGIDTGSMLASLGVAGLTIGFAAKDALSNVICGLFIFWDRPFVIGDLVEIDGRYGRVDQITMRSTRVVTVDGKMLAIPNTIIANTTVTSYTNFPSLRVDVGVTVGVGEDLGKVRKLLLDMVADDPQRDPEREAQVVVAELNDYNVALEVRVWIHDEKQHVAYRFALRERVFDTLTQAGVDLPFETLVVHSGQAAA